MMLSKRIRQAAPSRTAHFAALVAKLRSQGEPIINLAIGEPHAPVSETIIAATRHALENGQTRYSANAGLPVLREAIARFRPYHQPENIIVTNGSKQALFNLFQVLCDPGDEVIIPLPCWVSFPEQVKLAGGKPILVATRNNQLDLDAIANAVGTSTRALLINSPNNPTGAVYPARDLEKIGALALEKNLVIVSDEAYARYVYDGSVFTSLASFQDLEDRVVVTGSFSKSYNMTGFRVGYALGPVEIIAAMTALQGHATGNVCTFAQHGALEALLNAPDSDEQVQADFQKKRDSAFGAARELFDCRRPAGAFYLFPDVTRVLQAGQSSEEFAIFLLSEARVAVMPGEAFGIANHIRIAFAAAENDILTAFERIRNVL